MYNNVQDCAYLALQLQYICKINIAKLHKNCIKIVFFLHFSCKLQKNVLSLHCFYKERTTKVQQKTKYANNFNKIKPFEL